MNVKPTSTLLRKYKSLALKAAAASQEHIRTLQRENEFTQPQQRALSKQYVMRSVPFSWESVNSVLLALYLIRNR